MRYAPALFLILGGAAVASACGTDDVQVGHTENQSRSDGCKSNADCPAGQSCRSVRVGEVEERSCVADAVDDDAGPVLVSDATVLPPSTIPDGSPDAPLVVGDDAGDASTIPTDAGAICHKALSVTMTETGPYSTCTFNTAVVESSPATLDFVCAGGQAQVTFGSQTFTGTVSAGKLDIKNVTTYPIYIANPGVTCYYTATQTISGVLASGSLAYGYTEKLATNQSPPICKLVSAGCFENGTVSAE